MTSAINAQINQGLFILLTASVLFVGGWIHTAAAERLTIAENLVSELLTELESIEKKIKDNYDFLELALLESDESLLSDIESEVSEIEKQIT